MIGNPFALPPNRAVRLRGAGSPSGTARSLELVLPLLRRRDAAPASYDDLASELVVGRSAARPDGADGPPGGRRRCWPRTGCLRPRAAWMLMLVAEHPELTGEVGLEAHRFAAARTTGEPGTCDDGRFATAVVLETLRLYPATWLISRTARGRGRARGLRVRGWAQVPGQPVRDPPRRARSSRSARSFRPGRWLGRGSPERGLPGVRARAARVPRQQPRGDDARDRPADSDRRATGGRAARARSGPTRGRHCCRVA